MSRARRLLKIVLAAAAAITLTAASGYQVNYNTTSTITEWNICKKVTNAHTSGKAIFVPTNTSTEWSTFRSKAPAGVTLARCNTWTQVADFPNTRSYDGAALLGNGDVLFCGGYTAGTTVTSRCDTYSVSGNAFTQRANMASAKMALGMVGMNSGLGFLTAGYTGSGEAIGTYSYNSSTNTMTTLTSHPSGRHGFSIARDSSGNIYTFGGYVGSTTGSAVYRYNVSANSWTTMNNLPSARRYSNAETLASGKIIICGGKNGSNAYLNRCDLYNPSNDTYTQLANLPEAKATMLSASLEDGTALFCGGLLTDTTSSNRCDVYDEGTDSFTQVADYPENVGAGAMAPLNDGRVIGCSGDPANIATYSKKCFIYQP